MGDILVVHVLSIREYSRGWPLLPITHKSVPVTTNQLTERSLFMKCHEERRLGAQLASAAGATQTQTAIENKNKGFEDILKSAADECCERGGVEALVDNILKGPPRWAYAALRYLPDVGSRRDELLTKAAGDPSSAFHTLRHVSDVGNHRDLLVRKTAENPGWAHMTLRTVSDVGSHRDLLLAAVNTPPPEIGGGYNTYFVNQTGAQMWAMWNHGEQGTSGSIDGPYHFNKDQNVGYGRGGLCISEVRVYNHEPRGNTQENKWNDQGFSWNHGNIDGCLSWGFRITASSSGSLVFAEVYAWAEGQPGMPGQYPPANGS
jgi:hypothetical protein